MTKFYFTSFFILFFSIGFSQSYPYLNASTANENEFPVDKDTNIYMFHGNRLVKTDKNFNVIWAKTYSNFTFSRLLLSKTGSIFFISKNGLGNFFGKINPNGTMNWVKNAGNISAVLSGSTNVTYGVDCYGLLLDRNNNLVITGGEGFSQGKGFLIKTDTNGNGLKLKVFSLPASIPSYMNKFSILEDSIGYFKIIGSGYVSMGPYTDLAMYTYYDVFDGFSSANLFSGIAIPSYFEWRLIKSKFGNNFYIQSCSQNTLGIVTCGIGKYNRNGQVKWGVGFSNFMGIQHAFSGHVDESNDGDLFYSLSTYNFLQYYTSGYFKLDSNGVLANNYATTMLSNYNLGWCCSFGNIPNHSARVIHSNNNYFDISGDNFPFNPLTLQKFNSALTYACSSTVSCNSNSGPFTNTLVSINNPTLVPVTSYTIPSYTTVVTSISFSINPNFCIVLGGDEINHDEIELVIHPNPTAEKIYINEMAISLTVFDLNGKKVKNFFSTRLVDVSDLANGIYFIRIKTDKGEFNKKFIKN